MKRSNASIVIPACLSAAVHVALLTVLPRYFSSGPDDSWSWNLPTATVAPVPDALPELPETEIGDRTGKGYATHEVDAKEDATAREAETDQAYLGLTPPGVDKSGSGKGLAQIVGSETAGESGSAKPQTPRSVSPFGVASELQLPRPAAVRQPEPPPPTAVTDADAGGAIFGETTVPVESPKEAAPLPQASSPSAEATPQPADKVALAPQPTPPSALTEASQSASASVSGLPQPAGSPARMSDSESDPFSRLGSVTFRDGRLDVQFGRKVKTRKPKILLAGTLDLITLRRASVVLKIDIDDTGKVTNVVVDKSSGSNDIDQPTRVAVYDWWFEPLTDATGKPLPDHLKFTINWR